MKIIITKQQYKKLVYNLLDTVTGGELVVSENRRETIGYVHVYNSYGETVMNIFDMKGSGRNKGCKRDLGLESDFVIELENYVPYFKHKIFSKVLVDYVYEKTGIKCDCVDYGTDYRLYDTQDGGGYFNSRFAYNVKKKKRIHFESIDERQSLDEIIYNFLEDDYYPDYNWGSELFDFYKNDVEEYGSATFYINDNESYTYYSDGTLEIMPNVTERLDSWFNDSWKPVFKKWFEEHSGLRAQRIVTMDGVVKLNESINKNKKLINDIIGFDFTGRIKQITSTYDAPMGFDECISGYSIKRYLNFWGPMYLVDFGWTKMLYQDRGEFEWFMDEQCNDFVDNEIPEKLGIDILGLRFSDIIDMYFNEEE
jgi:hypothetical protein